jgi:hypothetical protein
MAAGPPSGIFLGMLNVLALAICLFQQSDQLGLEPPKGWTVQEDPQKRFTAYVPPDLPATQGCALMVFPAQEVLFTTTDEYLDWLIKNSSQGGEIQDKIQKVDVGAFRAGIFTLKTAQGQIQYVIVHAARWGARGQAVLYFASDFDLFKAKMADVLGMLNKAVVPKAAAAAAPAPAAAPRAAGKRIEAGNLLLPLPDGWTRQEAPSGWTILIPPDGVYNDNPRLWVSPAMKIEGSHWTAHRALLQQLVDGAKMPGGSRVDTQDVAPGPFIQSWAHCLTDGSRGIRLFTAAANGTMAAIALTPAREIGGDDIIRTLFPMFEQTKLKNAPDGLPRPEIREAYRRPAQKQFLNVDGTRSVGRVAYERMLLLANGTADCRGTTAEGYDGNSDALKMDSGTLNGFFGKWTADGKTVRIQRTAAGSEEVYERDGGTLRFGAASWTSIPRVDGLKLKGRWARKSAPGTGLQYNDWIEFTEEGAFRSSGLLNFLSIDDLTKRPKPLDPASGTYEFRNWTLWLKVNGTPIWSADVMPLKDDVKDLDTLLINTFAFTREK